jgi:DNA-binding FadR family transcriptional regulator
LPLQAVEPRRLYRQIAEQIAQLIASGEFLPGSRLPAERELAALLGVSRASVREAIISLEIGGLVEVRVGTGKTDFVVNGVVVHTEPRTGALAKTDGIYGIRVNHQLEVHVDGLAVTK